MTDLTTPLQSRHHGRARRVSLAALKSAARIALIGLCVLQWQLSHRPLHAQATGLVAAYGFDEGTGTTLTDASGNVNTGTISGATWATGKYGGALQFNGASSKVTVPDSASLGLTAGMTLEAWVFPTVAPSGWRAIMAKDTDRYYLFAGTGPGTPAVGGTFSVGGNANTFAPSQLAVGNWTHMAATFDGANVRIYINGIQTAVQPQTGLLTTSTGALEIGADVYGENFAGLIDELRIYNRALSAAEIQGDMGLPVSGPQGPRLTISQPTGVATISGTTVNVAYNLSGDLTGVDHVNFQLDAAPEVTDPTSDGTYQFSGVAAGPHTLTGRLMRADNTAIPNTNASVSFTTTVPDTTPPTAPSNLGATASGVQVTLNWTAATDNVGVTGYRIESCQGAGCSSFAEIATATGTSYVNIGLAQNSSYSYRVRATDAAGLLGPYSNVASATTGTAPPATGLVAAYGFDETSGTTTPDQSGNNNTGTIVNATRTTAGKYGGAMTFNGSNTKVTVPDSASLDLTQGMTIEAWVKPTSTPSGWRSIVHKDVDRYYLMAGSTPQNRPAVGGTFGTTNQNVKGTAVLALNTWTHLAATYDRTTIRLYVNGVQVATGAQTGAISTSNAILEIGADSSGEFFAGVIDEVRIYNRSLSLAELQTDMSVPVSGPPGPKLVITQPTAGSTITGTTVNVSYTTTGDLTGVDHVHFQLDGNPIVMDLTFDGVYQFTNVSAGSHTLNGFLVHADHSAVPGSDATPVSFATTIPDSTPPTVSLTSPLSGATVSGTVTMTADAADNVTVAGVTFKVDGTTVGTEDTTSPYSVGLNTTTLANGSHTATATARDFANNSTVSTAVTFTVSNANPNDPSRIGQFSAVQTWPIVTVHAVLLPSGDVIGWSDYTNNAGAQIWRPSTNTFVRKDYDQMNLFCSGHSYLADGKLFVAGGADGAHDFGPFNSTIFDPATETWSAGPLMAARRYYPTNVTLGDGRVLVLGGTTTCGTCIADIPEIYNPQTNSWTSMASSARMPFHYYPHPYLLADGRILIAAQDDGPVPTQVLDLASQTWTTIDPRTLDGHSSVMYLPGKILKAGTATADNPGNPSEATAYVLDATVASPAWVPTASMAFPRSFLNLTVLPDGNVLATGGGRTTDNANFSTAVFEAEMWSPSSGTWSTMARMQTPRLYHSIGLLLPDGRVLVSGGGRENGLTAPDPKDQESAEIYSPPYLFKGARPSITSAPPAIQYATNFTITTPDASRIATVSLIPLGAVTHAFNENQRYVPLSFTKGTGTLTATAPANGNLAPPGPYMLFIVDTNGIPSVAAMTKMATFVSPPDTTPPTAPTNLTATPSGPQITLNWTAATDNVIVSSYRVERCQGAGCSNFTEIATSTSTSFLNNGLAGSTSYSYRVRAQDGIGNLGPYSNVATATTGAVGPALGLVAAYGFDETSGSTVSDVSGFANTGTIDSAIRVTTGKYGGALSFNGSAQVTVPDSSSLDLTTGMTLEAWVNPSAAPSNWRALIAKNQDRYYMMASTNNNNWPGAGGTFGTTNQNVFGASVLPTNTWTHLAVTYDGAQIRFYVNGTQISTFPETGNISTSNTNLTIGADVYGEQFSGLIDEVRIYNRALSQPEISTDMATPVTVTGPRLTISQPASGATISGTTVNVLYTSSGDQTGVDHAVFQLDSNPEVPDPTLDGVFQFANVSVGPHTLTGRLVRADNSAIPNTTTSVTFTTTVPDTTPPGAPGTLGASANGTSITLNWGAATDNVGVTGYHVERCQSAGCSNFAEIATDTGLTYQDNGLAATTSYSYRVRANDGANLLGPYSNTATATTGTITTPSGLVAAYGFDETSGTTTSDRSGNNNTGTLVNATRTTAGKYGSALSFNGSAQVNVPDSASLDLTTGFTLEAWVSPSATPSGWRALLAKDVDRYYLMAGTNSNAPGVGGTFGTTNTNVFGTAVLATNVWTHVAATYDGATIRFYINGVQVSSQAQTGAVSTSNSGLTIGADFYGENFNGKIDEVRIYNRALTLAEIQNDMAVPVTPGP